MLRKSLIVLDILALSPTTYAQTTKVNIVGKVERNVEAKVYVGSKLICQKRAWFTTQTLRCKTYISGSSGKLTLRTKSSNGDGWSHCDSWSDNGSSRETCTLNNLDGSPRDVGFDTTEDEIDE